MKSTFLALSFIGFQSMLWFGEHRVWKVFSLHQRCALEKEQYQQLVTHMTRLEEEVNLLKKPLGPSSIAEDYVRFHLGQVKSEEWFCHLQR